MNYYDILGVKSTASEADIKTAFRRLAMQHHPDRNPDKKGSDTEFKKINEAYSTLSDATKRKKYDNELLAAKTGSQQRTYQTSGDDIDDIMKNVFRNGRNPFDDIFSRASETRSFSVTLQFWEAVFGVSKRFEVALTQNNGTKKNYMIDVPFPAGISHGETLKVNVDNQLIHIDVRVLADENFQRDNLDLYTEIDIPMSLAALGGKYIYPHWKGDLEINIPEGTQNGQKLRLSSAGIQKQIFNGDMYLTCNVIMPKKMTKKQKELMQQFSKLEKEKANPLMDKLKKTWATFKKP